MRSKVYGKIFKRWIPFVLLEIGLLSLLLMLISDEQEARRVINIVVTVVVLMVFLGIFKGIFQFERSMQALDHFQREELEQEFFNAEWIGSLCITSKALLINCYASTAVVPYQNIMAITREGAAPAQTLVFHMRPGRRPKVYRASFNVKMPEIQVQELLKRLDGYIKGTAVPQTFTEEQKQQYGQAKKQYRRWLLTSPVALVAYGFLHLLLYFAGFLLFLKISEYVNPHNATAVFWSCLAQIVWIYGFTILGIAFSVWGMIKLFSRSNKGHLDNRIGINTFLMLLFVAGFELFITFVYSADQDLIQRTLNAFAWIKMH